MKNKIFTRIIITTLLCAFLTVNVGKVTRVSAVGTTIAASAAAALCAVGIVYCSYMALTGASVHVPSSVENIESWLTDMGTKVVQYPSGRAAYEELYPELIGIGDEPLTSLLDRAWTWTTDKLKTWANDFSSTEIISEIAAHVEHVDVSNIPLNGYDYDFTIVTIPNTVSFSQYGGPYYEITKALYDYDGPLCVYEAQGRAAFVSIYDPNVEHRNYKDGSMYYPQHYVNGTWQNMSGGYTFGVYTAPPTEYFIPNGDLTSWYANRLSWNIDAHSYPLFPNEAIYDSETEQYLPMVIPSDLVTYKPNWPALPPGDDNKPVIPYLKLPYDPNWIDPVTNLSGGGNWGFNLAELLDALEDLANLLIDIGTIGQLINDFKDLISGSSGDEYYIYYDDSNNNYYRYYTITNFGDNIYNYDIDVSEVDEHLPVDLNIIQTYSSNRYLEQIKQSAINGSSIVRDFAVFWYDVDPEVTYIAFGICILILLGAFTGKLGHS